MRLIETVICDYLECSFAASRIQIYSDIIEFYISGNKFTLRTDYMGKVDYTARRYMSNTCEQVAIEIEAMLKVVRNLADMGCLKERDRVNEG